MDLSDAERRVASLAARGCTNREISRKLFVTVSTVEQHLTRVYRKLRINSRSDLPTSLLSCAGNPPEPSPSSVTAPSASRMPADGAGDGGRPGRS